MHDQARHDQPADHPGREGHDTGGLSPMAASATLHCLTGCAIGEIAGLMIGTAAGLGSGWTIALSIALAFVFGFGLSSLPLLEAGLTLAATLGVVVAADTLSIATTEVVDNAVMALIPGAMDAGLVNVLFWVAMVISLSRRSPPRPWSPSRWRSCSAGSWSPSPPRPATGRAATPVPP